MPATITYPAPGRLDVGDTWLMPVTVTLDTTGALTAGATVTCTVTRPDTSTATPTPATVTTGLYLASYVLAAPGRHTAVVTASGAVVSVVRFEVEAVSVTALPTSAETQQYLQALGATSYGLPDIAAALAAETAAQRSRCRIPAAYPLDLREALLRRVARNLAARGVPIATYTSFEGGGTSARVPMQDAEIVRLEAPYRRRAVG